MGTCSTSRLLACFLVVLWSGRLHNANACYSSIISFGDSIADTGNRKHLALATNQYFSCDRPPYGQNFIGQSTGRCSNGRLIIDFLGNSIGLCENSYVGVSVNCWLETVWVLSINLMDTNYFTDRSPMATSLTDHK